MLILPFLLAALVRFNEPPMLEEQLAPIEESQRHITHEMRRYARILAAPRMQYELLKVYSYRDRVIVEVRATNKSRFPIRTEHVALMATPYLSDDHGWNWGPDYTPRCACPSHFDERDIVFPPNESVTFQKMIGSATGPLHRVEWLWGWPCERPERLDYQYFALRSGERLDVVPSERESYGIIGHGGVAIVWSDEEAPRWPAIVKIDPPAGVLAAFGGLPASEHWPRDRSRRR